MKKLILLMILMAIASLGFSAVSSGYSFAYSSGTYVENTTGTVLGVETNDDTSFNALSIGFTFNYNGVDYTQFSVSSNGFIVMGATAVSSYTPISTGSSNNVISALSRDLQGQTGASLTYQTFGVDTDRILVVQWKNYRKYGATGDNYNFQIMLYEGTNKVEVVYGTMINNVTAATPQVGLRGPSSADFNNRTTITNWLATTAGTLNSATCTLSSTVFPPSGTTFAWTVNPLFPEPTNHVTDFAVNTAGIASIKLTWTGSTGAQLPQGYLILGKTGAGTYASVADGVPVANDLEWTDYNAAYNVAYGTNEYTFTGLTPNTAYDFVIYPYTNGEANIAYKTDAPVPSVSTSTIDPAIIAFPHNESFDGTLFAPDGWTNTATVGTYLWDRQTVGTFPTCTPHSGAGMARYNSYNSSAGNKALLITRPINFPADDYRINFWMFRDITDYQTSADLVNVYYNTAANTTGATLMGTINRACGLAPIVTAEGWYNYTYIMPAGATGNGRYIIFEAVSAYGNNMFIDDVIIEQVPAAPIFVLEPNITSWDFGQVPVNNAATKQFTISNTGGGNLILSSVNVTGAYYTLSVPPVDTDLTAGESTTLTVQYLPTVDGGPYAGQLVINDNRATTTVDLTGSAYAPSTLPLSEGFEAGFGDWIIVNDTQTNQWYTGTAAAYTGTQSAYISNDGGVSNAYDVAVTSVVHMYQDFAFDAANLNFPLSFWWKGVGESDYYDYLQVFLVDTSVTPVAGVRLTTGQIGVNYNMQTVWNQANITIPGTESGLTKRLVFSWWNDSSLGTQPPIAVDDISLTATPLPTDPIFSVVPDSKDFGALLYHTTATQDFVISNQGGGTLTVSDIALDPSSHAYYTITALPTLPVNLAFMETATFTVEYAPTVEGGPYTGTVNITDSRLITPVALTGTCFDPTEPIPYLQNFEIPTSLAGINWTGNMYISTPHGTDSSKGLYYNLYSSSPICNAVSCPIGPLAAVSQLKFDYRIMDWSGYPSAATVLGVSDSVQIQVSNDFGATYTTVYTINSVNHVTSTSFANLTLDLTAYAANTIMVQFLGTWGQGDYYLDIDNVVVRETPSGPPDPVTLNYPANEATGLPQSGFNLTWSPAVTGGVPTYYAVYMSQDPETIYEGSYWETNNPYYNPVTEGLLTFAFDAVWYWTVEAFNLEGSAVVDPARRFTIQSDPRITIPHTQDFGTDVTPVWPLNWTQSFTTGGSNRWAATASNIAGGIANEMTLTWTSGDFISRLITPPINTDGLSMFQVKFKQTYDGYGPGITAKVQYSHDLITWYDTSWNIISSSATIGPNTASTVITGLTEPVTYVAWALDGDHYQVDYWYVDDVILQIPLSNDVGVVSYDVPLEVVPENTLVTPIATVANYGVSTQTFDVTCVIGTYSNTQTVTGLAFGATQQVTFASLTPALFTAENVVLTTVLATDEDITNDVLTGALICLPLDTAGLANNAQTNEFVQFNLATPETLVPLANGYTGSYFVAGADWVNGNWMGVEYDDGTLTSDNYFDIDPLTGLYADMGDPGAALMGIAYDDDNDIMYGVTGTTGFLYQMNPLTGAIGTGAALWYNLEGTIYNLTDIGGLMIDIAYDNFGDILYGIDLGNDCLWTINTATYELTLVGFLGVDLNYAQDAAFDQENGLLFLAGYSASGNLYWIDTFGGGAYKVGLLGSIGYELTGFAIPYGLAPETVVVTIASTGALSWANVLGAAQYKVYCSDDPYGPFTYQATVYGNTWTDPLFPQEKKFYQVTAVGGRTVSNRQPVVQSNPMRKAGILDQNKRNETGLANRK